MPEYSKSHFAEAFIFGGGCVVTRIHHTNDITRTTHFPTSSLINLLVPFNPVVHKQFDRFIGDERVIIFSKGRNA